MSANTETNPSLLVKLLEKGGIKVPPLFLIANTIMEKLAEQSLLQDNTSFPQR
jgi:hypothetical protein